MSFLRRSRCTIRCDLGLAHPIDHRLVLLMFLVKCRLLGDAWEKCPDGEEPQDLCARLYTVALASGPEVIARTPSASTDTIVAVERRDKEICPMFVGENTLGATVRWVHFCGGKTCYTGVWRGQEKDTFPMLHSSG